MKRQILIVFGLGLIALAIVPNPFSEYVRGQASGGANSFQSYSKPMPLPDFSLEDLAGKKVQIKDYRGRVILLHFWATWCPECLKESPSLEKVYLKYRPQGLAAFRIDTKESRKTIEKFLEKNPSGIPILLDQKNEVGKLLGLWVHPTSYLVDKNGKLRYRVMGGADWQGVEAVSIIDKLMEEK